MQQRFYFYCGVSFCRREYTYCYLIIIKYEYVEEFFGVRIRYAHLHKRAVNWRFDVQHFSPCLDDWRGHLATLAAAIQPEVRAHK